MYKTKRPNNIPIDDYVYKIISSQIAITKQKFPNAQYVFVNSKGDYFSNVVFSTRIKKEIIKHNVLGRDGKLLRFGTHIFRATKATKLINMGQDPKTVASTLGHANLASLSYYSVATEQRNTKAMINYNVTKGKNNRERVLAAIEQCKKEGNISAKRVAQIAGVHECYFSRYPEMRKTLDIAMGIVNRNLKKTKQNDNSKDVLNHALYVELNNLKRENAKLEDYKKYKDMYESKCEEVEELKKQLEQAYNNTEMFNF